MLSSALENPSGALIMFDVLIIFDVSEQQMKLRLLKY
jgi:mRNA-degrading endonuclease YafQ of YafQ-DinJ toxin-antitoxin module